jgi:hypothetical protein
MRGEAAMAEILSQDEIDQLLTAVNAGVDRTDGAGRTIVIDYDTFCSRLIGYGFDKRSLAEVKAALLEAELAYRLLDSKKNETAD